MDLIERYIYAVIRYLPPKQRPDIEKELRSLIEDMLEQRTGGQEPQKADIEAILLELGEPRKLADNYRGTARYLISPLYFELYWLILRIVLIASGGGVLIATAISVATNPPATPWSALGEIFGSVYNVLLGAFGMVTLIFALIERFGDRSQAEINKLKDSWHPGQLPQKPVSALIIKRSEPIVAIVFLVIVMILININLDMIGVYYQSNGISVMMPLFSDYIHQFLPWINLSIVLTILIEIVKIFTGRWTFSILIASLVQKILSLVIGLQLFASPKIFNPEFFTDANVIFAQANQPLPADLSTTVCRVLIIVTIVAFAIDVLTLGVKAVRLALGLADNRQYINK